MAELGLDDAALAAAVVRRALPCAVPHLEFRTAAVDMSSPAPRVYAADAKVDNRSAWGAALVDLASDNSDLPIAVLDCDLAVSVKTDGFRAVRPEGFIQCGVGEHNAATVGGALSTVPGVVAFWSDFGVFGIDEAYNQQRLNDINGAALKLVVTHCGLDVGEDGKTHQCLDYVGAFRGFYGWKVIVPSDANQTAHAIAAAAMMQGNVAVAMGRSKLPMILTAEGELLFGEGYHFEYGSVAWAREGADACVLAMGTLSGVAVAASDLLREQGIHAAVGLVACPLGLDDEAMSKAAAAPLLLTVEDHAVGTGLGASVAEWLALRGEGVRFDRLGVEGYQPSGAATELYARIGLDAVGIATRISSQLR
jgi:transketolase